MTLLRISGLDMVCYYDAMAMVMQTMTLLLE